MRTFYNNIEFVPTMTKEVKLQAQGEGTNAVGGARPTVSLNYSGNLLLFHHDYTLSASCVDATWTLTSITAAHWSQRELHAVWRISGINVVHLYLKNRKAKQEQSWLGNWLIFLDVFFLLGVLGISSFYQLTLVFVHADTFRLNRPSGVSVCCVRVNE